MKLIDGDRYQDRCYLWGKRGAQEGTGGRAETLRISDFWSKQSHTIMFIL